MKRLLSLAAVICTALAIALVASPAQAQTATNTLTVEADVVGVCNINAATLDFDTYDATAGDLNDSGTITVNCTQGSAFWIGLDLGANPAGATRQMANGTSRLQYQLYRDAARTQLWDNTDGGLGTVAATQIGAGLGAQPISIYGTIPGNQLVPVGYYSDSVTMTVNF
jgi:spore coat protein U-like protein